MNLYEKSSMMIEELNKQLDSSELIDGGLRLDLVYQCCEISIEHGIAVKTLLETELYTSALALFRVQFESTIRAYWLLLSATNNQILKFQTTSIADLFKNEKIPMVSEMIEKLKNIEEIRPMALQFEEFKFYSLKHLNLIVHTGKHSLVRSTFGLNEKQYSDVMKQSNGLTTMAGQILLRHSGKEKWIHILHAKYRDCFLMQKDISSEEKARIDAMYNK
ncbi:hypothetical protein HLH17_00155 [Acinetobacter sp. ANC 5380]|uniref:Uncharacterized protein n=1 Tax=Acinetobacter terrae TaxID=2731247 RepID=A0A7Y2RCL8_9GAMM|nr:hypothetical protein [Acinetobacter terrae]NNH76124.1 hypothetical protein [Acinetobacter terrae]